MPVALCIYACAPCNADVTLFQFANVLKKSNKLHESGSQLSRISRTTLFVARRASTES